MPSAPPMPMRCWSVVQNQNAMMGSERKVSALFHVSSQAVTGRLARLSVVPALLIFKVTPPPE
jgi:hypothetical protein